MENMNRRSFFGVLGGAVAATTVATSLVAEAGWPEKETTSGETTSGEKKAALRIDEWDEGTIHMIHITTQEDVDLGVGFSPVGSRSLHIPMSGNFNLDSAKLQIANLRRGSRHATILVHEGSTVTRVGSCVTDQPLCIENMRLNVPVRLI